MVADDWQGTGLGTHLFRLLVAHAGRGGIDWFTGTIQYSNVAALRLVRRVGAQIHLDAPGVLRADIDLRPLTAACDPASNDRCEPSLGNRPLVPGAHQSAIAATASVTRVANGSTGATPGAATSAPKRPSTSVTGV